MQIRPKQVLLAMAAAFTFQTASYAQGDSAPKDWFHLDNSTDGYNGVSSKKLYNELLKGKKSKTVIVAVIDSGVDWEHEDLDDVMWVNEDEIPGNGIDDDGNGYIDDIHGWNFIGGPNGNVDADNLELTRLYRKYRSIYGNRTSDEGLSKKEKKEYAKYLHYKEHYDKNRESAQKNLERFETMQKEALSTLNAVQKALGKKKLTLANVKNIEPGANEKLATGKEILMEALKEDPSIKSIKQLKEEVSSQFKGGINYYSNQFNKYYNVDFDPRAVVADNYGNQSQRIYGNNDYEGPEASHGTHVAGIIAAERNNGVGMDGVANDVRIMTIRCVPDGDERDKDVANSIRYAVDNGASIINMSFGKGFSWNKKIVDDAVKYAAKNDVLLVHAAGNSNQDNDVVDNFPKDTYEKAGLFSPKYSKTWMEVGALDHKQGAYAPARFSNYGKNEIDLFSPGVDIYSTVPDNKYAKFNGTSMASPVAAGVAALIRSYYPTLSAVQVKEIMMSTVTPNNEMVYLPGSEKKVPFSSLSVSGGTVNAYAAMKKAATVKGKGKVKKTKAYKAMMKETAKTEKAMKGKMKNRA